MLIDVANSFLYMVNQALILTAVQFYLGTLVRLPFNETQLEQLKKEVKQELKVEFKVEWIDREIESIETEMELAKREKEFEHNVEELITIIKESEIKEATEIEQSFITLDSFNYTIFPEILRKEEYIKKLGDLIKQNENKVDNLSHRIQVVKAMIDDLKRRHL